MVMARCSIQHYLLICVVIALVCATRVHSADALIRKLFVFGDSVFDAGNYEYVHKIPRQWPYGVSYPNITRGRFSDGLILPDYIALYMNLSLIPAYLKPGSDFKLGANFAVASAATLDSSSPGNLNLKGQVANLKMVLASLKKTVGEAKAKEEIKRSIFLFSFGGLDYIHFWGKYPNATEEQTKAFRNYVIGNFTDAMRDIYNAGGRKFAFQNVGPFGCYPGNKGSYHMKSDECYEKLNKLMVAHNEAFLGQITRLHTQIPDLHCSVFDYYNAIRNRIQNPTKYGFKVGDIACCGTGPNGGNNCGGSGSKLCDNPKEYVYFDRSHTTQSANKQLAELFWSGGLQDARPRNLRDLFALAPDSFESLLQSVTDDVNVEP